mmetsp:Transcript_33161/g.71771  ORF Transcript_33161/g.71771 Transcript_33161/m.71771 type:complete len:258 (+) Transcript_33161:277-1050(+)
MWSVAFASSGRSWLSSSAATIIGGAARPSLVNHYTIVKNARPFFASSTDHTTLLSSADAYCVGTSNRTYFLVPADTPQDLAERVDKLHLARLYVAEDGKTIFGAKVVQRTLGDVTEVCGRLLDMAIKDVKSTGTQPVAVTTLHGLCQWVEDGLCSSNSNGVDSIDALNMLDADTVEAVKAVATGVPRPGHSVVGVGTYRDGEKGWKTLANAFIDIGMSSESELYKSRGGELEEIIHLGDDTKEGLTSAGGAVAKFKF